VIKLPMTREDRLHCDAQTLVNAKLPVRCKDVQHIALGTFSDAPSASSLVPDFSGNATIVLAPRECTGSAIATPVSAQLELMLIMTPKLMFRSGWQWPQVSLDTP